MARIALTEREVEIIVAAPKTISKNVEWHSDQNESWLRCELPVESSLKVNLKVYINVNAEDLSLHSFSLLLNNYYRIRGLDVNGSHRNTHIDSNRWQARTHKHRWTDVCRQSFAYTPNETFRNEITENFRLFCEECNIDFRAEIKPLPPKQLTFNQME